MRPHLLAVAVCLAAFTCDDDTDDPPADDATVAADGGGGGAIADASNDSGGIGGFGGMAGFGGAGGFAGGDPLDCVTPNPQGCVEQGCPVGEICRVGDACAPSRCLCEDGAWVCTEDCGGGTCVETGDDVCPGPNPQGCAATGCPEGEGCVPTDGCIASTCDCMQGEWACSDDCEGGVCLPLAACGALPDFARCGAGNACEPGSFCEAGRACADVDCDCVDGRWTCPPDCYSTCREEAPPACPDPNPQGCVEGGCPAGELCQVGEECVSSACECGRDGVWACTPDCGGGRCVPAPMCEGPNPQGCRERGCEAGEICRLDAGCFPSSCQCGPQGWRCTRDCGGGLCVAEGECAGPVPFFAECAFDEDCAEGDRCAGRACGPDDCECDADGQWVCPPECGTMCIGR